MMVSNRSAFRLVRESQHRDTNALYVNLYDSSLKFSGRGLCLDGLRDGEAEITRGELKLYGQRFSHHVNHDFENEAEICKKALTPLTDVIDWIAHNLTGHWSMFFNQIFVPDTQRVMFRFENLNDLVQFKLRFNQFYEQG